EDPLHLNVMTNDGGNAFFMENMEGRRYIDFFSGTCFPETVDVMNPIQAGPGVELAPLKQAVGMDTAVTRVFKKAREVCESDPDFTINDLCSFDTSINMSISVGSFFDLFEEMKASGEFGSDEDIIHEIAAYHVFAVGSTQKLGLLEDPRYPPNTIEKVAETDHVLLADTEKGLSRAEIPGWYMSGPNVLSFSRLMAQAHGELPSAELGGPADKLRRIMIGVPQMLTGPSGTDQYYTMLKHLKDMGVRTRQGPDIWWKFRPDSFVPEKRGGRHAELSLVRSFDMSARVHRAGVKRLLDDSDVLYIPADTELSGGTAELYHYLLTFSGAVRRQLLLESAPLVIMERGPFADKFIEVVKSLKSVGLVGQKIEDIVTLTNGPEESADAIGKYFERFRPHKIEYKEEKRRRSRKHEHRGPYMVTGFGSAKSTHKEFIEKAYQSAYLFAINGMSLKVGGGNDGVMRALAEGFLRGKQVLRERGHMFPNQIILIQCHETESIEGKYIPSSDIQVLKRDVIHYSYPNIEGRRYDLVQTNLAVDFGGGIGTCEEDLDVQIDVASNSSNSAKKKTRRMIFNQMVKGNNGGQVGIWDAYIEHFGHLSSLDTSSVVMTVGELVTQADWHRRSINDERISKRHLFVPSFPLITDPKELPPFAAQNVVSIRLPKVA
ncbi:MAG TPA: hypothetical protein PKH37_01415, partial [Alphaproteobacteria bacterium]|nr:hypothetical protein [Alphaproteobacteria bacterium]